jgi:hypothetical protein
VFALEIALADVARSSASGTDVWTLIPAWIGAAAVLIGWLAFLMTRRQRRRRTEREEQLTRDVAEMGDAIGDLSTMVTSLAEEMRGRAPRLQLRFSTKDGPSPAVVARIPAVPLVDVEAIVAHEREAVLATRPPLARAKLDRSALPPDMQPAAAEIARISSLMATAGNRFGAEKYLPVSDEDYAAFDKKVETYCGDVRAFVSEWLEYLAKRRVAVVFGAQIDNDGGAPAEEARVKLFFPDPCGEGELPNRPELPSRPRFERRLNPMHRSNLGMLAGFNIDALGLGRKLPDIRPINFNPDHSGPHYKKGSLEITYNYDSLPHHDPVELAPFVVGIPQSGRYNVRWTIGAKNLVRLEEGMLEVEVIHEDAHPDPVVSLGELVKARHSSS